MNIYQNNLLKIKKEYHGIFDALYRAATKFGVNFFLIGAQCRDVWSHHIAIQRRVSRDIDYTVELGNMETWELLKNYLVEEEKMEPDEREPYRFKFGDQILDIVPFGGISDGIDVTFRSPDLTLSVVGLKEVTESGFVSFDECDVVSSAGL